GRQARERAAVAAVAGSDVPEHGRATIVLTREVATVLGLPVSGAPRRAAPPSSPASRAPGLTRATRGWRSSARAPRRPSCPVSRPEKVEEPTQTEGGRPEASRGPMQARDHAHPGLDGICWKGTLLHTEPVIACARPQHGEFFGAFAETVLN